MGWKNVAAGLGTQAAVSGLKAAKDQMSKRQYKRLIATAVAQLLELHPDIGRKKARKRAQRLTGARPSKKLLRAVGPGPALAAAATTGVAGVAGILGSRSEESGGAGEDNGRQPDAAGDGQPSASAAEG
ncbi:MAG TPA: hypothetical protein VMN37_09505 [Gemmatimonadales bacterium]|nr:hypothetical protein [Gemmatimonadales bacterium]